jgi:hypothetical protein
LKNFHISDVLSVTTPRLLSSRHMEGVYEILNFLTGDSLYTHQLPRACREVRPWMATQFPQLMDGTPEIDAMLKQLDINIEACPPERESRGKACSDFVERVRVRFGLPEYLAVYEMPCEQHTHIDPIEEAKAMVGDDKVIVLEP